jgi:RNA polymerase sigma factor (sigma-70 family)
VILRNIDSPCETGEQFTHVYNQYFSLVMRYIRTQHGTVHPEAEDIAQDIFSIIWRRRDRLLKLGPLEKYLYVMVRNRLLNEQRKAKRHRIWRQRQPGLRYTPAFELSGPRAERLWQAAVEALPASAQTAHLLRHQAGLKVHRVAKILGISQAGASRQIQEAERRIRGFLEARLM